MKSKLYLDTSIPSAYFGNIKQSRQIITKNWFNNDSNNYNLYTSVLTIREINRFQNEEKKNNIKQLIFNQKISVLEISEEAQNLSKLYIKLGAIPKTEPEDALHIAIATINKIDFLASWNFKHIVSINPIKKIHEINQKNGYNIIEIGSLEMFGGYKYGNL